MSAPVEFIQAMQDAGLNPPPSISPGELVRFGKNKREWAKLFPDGNGGAFGDWSTGLSESWQAQREPMTAEQRRQFAQQIEESRRQAEAERQQMHAEAAEKAQKIYQEAQEYPDPQHPYLVAKGVKFRGGIRQHKGSLVVPVRDSSGKIQSLQFIRPDGGKFFLSGGKTAGGYFALGGKPSPDGTICIVEGLATGLSIYEATGHPVAVAFNAGNLLPVAQIIRQKLPDTRIVVCADDDHQATGNPGATAAIQAAQAINGLVAIPDFGNGRPEKATDFNDLHQHAGLEAVKNCIEAACPPDAGQDDQSDQITIEQLAALGPLEYDQVRKQAAEKLGVRPGTLDAEVRRLRKESSGTSELEDVEPWPEPVDGAALLDQIVEVIHRHIVCEPQTARATALWVAMSWFTDVIEVCPLCDGKGWIE